MFILANFLGSMAQLVGILFNIYIWIVIASALISWVNPDPYNPIVRFLHQVTEPLLNPIRRMMPWRYTGIDLSPVILLFILYFLEKFVVGTLIQLAFRIR